MHEPKGKGKEVVEGEILGTSRRNVLKNTGLTSAVKRKNPLNED